MFPTTKSFAKKIVIHFALGTNQQQSCHIGITEHIIIACYYCIAQWVEITENMRCTWFFSLSLTLASLAWMLNIVVVIFIVVIVVVVMSFELFMNSIMKASKHISHTRSHSTRIFLLGEKENGLKWQQQRQTFIDSKNGKSARWRRRRWSEKKKPTTKQ